MSSLKEIKNHMLLIKKRFKDNNDEIKHIKNLTKEYNRKGMRTCDCYMKHVALLYIYNDLFKQYQISKREITKFYNQDKYKPLICGVCKKWLAKCSVCGKWSKYMYNDSDITLCDDKKCIKISGYDNLDESIWDKPCYIGGCDSSPYCYPL